MISGFVKTTYEDILKATNGGYDVYKFYHGSVPKKCKSPFRRDNHASFGFFHYNGIWLWKDIKMDVSGGPIEFIMNKFGLKYYESIDKIAWDFGLGGNNKEGKIISWESPINIPKYSHISFTTTPFNNKHHNYWNEYHLNEDYLRRYNVFRVKDLAINRKKIKLMPEELTYVYWAEDIDKAKILRIGVGKDNKWRSNVPFNYIWYLNLLKDNEMCDKLFVCKSNKDALVLSLFGLDVLATQSENSSCITETTIEDINKKGFKTIVVYGSDEQGKKSSRDITEKTKWRHLNTPDEYLKEGINDFAEMAKFKGLKVVGDYLKHKKII